MMTPFLLSAVFFLGAAIGVAQADSPLVTPLVHIEGGAYTIGDSNGPASSRPRHYVSIRPFLIGAHEISNAQYAAFLNTLQIAIRRDTKAGAVTAGDVEGVDARRISGSGGRQFVTWIELDDDDAQIGIYGGRFAPGPGLENRPVAEVTWAGAVAYCAAIGQRLPTEVEWEAAARGKSGRIYPWGEPRPSKARAVFGAPKGETGWVDSNKIGATPEGLHHMAGNMAEWTSSLFKSYPYDPADGREDPVAPGERVTRGGDHTYDIAPEKLTAFFRDGFSRNPLAGHRHIGFRCARDR